MPTTVMARRDVAYALAAAKLAFSQQLAAAAAAGPAGSSLIGVVQGFSDPALAALPALLDDPVLLEEFTCRWWGRCKGLVAAMEQQAQVGPELQQHCLLFNC